MSDIKLPPLPEPTAFLVCKGSEVTARAWSVDEMRNYARAAVQANISATASHHSAKECYDAFEWLRREATKEGATEQAKVAFDEWAALKGAQPAVQANVPDGWVMVPVVPTEEMLDNVDEDVGGHCYTCTRWRASNDDCRRVWAAMLSAIPKG